MRRTPFAALALVFALAAGTTEAQTLKIGYINSQEILANAPGPRRPRRVREGDEGLHRRGPAAPGRAPADAAAAPAAGADPLPRGEAQPPAADPAEGHGGPAAHAGARPARGAAPGGAHPARDGQGQCGHREDARGGQLRPDPRRGGRLDHLRRPLAGPHAGGDPQAQGRKRRPEAPGRAVSNRRRRSGPAGATTAPVGPSSFGAFHGLIPTTTAATRPDPGRGRRRWWAASCAATATLAVHGVAPVDEAGPRRARPCSRPRGTPATRADSRRRRLPRDPRAGAALGPGRPRVVVREPHRALLAASPPPSIPPGPSRPGSTPPPSSARACAWARTWPSAPTRCWATASRWATAPASAPTRCGPGRRRWGGTAPSTPMSCCTRARCSEDRVILHAGVRVGVDGFGYALRGRRATDGCPTWAAP